MVPFSFPQPRLKSRVMKERSLPSSPLTGAKQAALPQLKNFPVCRCCHRKIPMSQISSQEPDRHPALFIFYPCPSVVKNCGLGHAGRQNRRNYKTNPIAIIKLMPQMQSFAPILSLEKHKKQTQFVSLTLIRLLVFRWDCAPTLNPKLKTLNRCLRPLRVLRATHSYCVAMPTFWMSRDWRVSRTATMCW
jgi:hypothetical protein